MNSLDREKQAGSDKFQFARLMGYYRPYLPLLLLSMVLVLVINAAVLIKPYIIKHVIDSYITKGINDRSALWTMGIIYFVLVVIGAIFTYAQSYILTYVGQKIMFNIRNSLFTHIQNMSMSFFDRNSTGRILTRVTNDVEALNDLFSGVLVNLFRDFVMVIGIVATMAFMDFRLMLVSVSCIPLIVLATVIYRIAARKNFIRMKSMIARINGFLAENISGMKLVQIFHREKEKFRELEELDREYFKFSFREIILNSFSRPLVDIINNLTIAVLIYFCTERVIGNTLEIGLLYAFITYIKQFFDPISTISEQYTTIQSAVVSSGRIFEILDTVDVQEDIHGGRPLGPVRGEIEFKNVWFAYNEEEWILKDLSFKIEAGETAAFVGATGSGKSTIISLLTRFYDIQKGEILLDGVNIKEFNLLDLRRQVSVVLQDVFLFSGDILSNIRLNNSEITDAEIETASKYVNAGGFIEQLPDKYHEKVKERGCTFSAGQRQLISFARAVAFKPSILVLDEATANIDTETELVIQNALAKITKGRTSIIIAHRLSTIRNADKIIVIHKGRLKEMGRHTELMEAEGVYSRLYRLQVTKK
ncbi:ABC transporter ATP-binding protein [Ruminiclostridium cellobioparum]|uniref:ABC transporter n=1 Tax=Ruminiclostridium cellobioparum subsp. termitidis CT1112 TaxID=1195236 RepID=S0FWD7_RUMCE|nr:ABC transporter ATP-binding protein [Ruminiclostridium cellobioparum]EMS72843.1 ABC transporter [Ruminiclostridium cellobioparum subsp. termitidis CT1112]